METSSAIIYLIVIIILITLSAFFSFSEMAIASSSKLRFKTIISEEKNRRIKKRVNKVFLLVENYNESITSIVIFNNIVNILASTLATTLFAAIAPGVYGPFIAFGLMTVLIIIFGELIPKMLAKKYPETGLIKFTLPLIITYWTFYPLALLFKKIVKQEDAGVVASEEELKEVIKAADKEDHITTFEHQLIKQTLDLDATSIKSIMIPIKDVVWISSKASKKHIISLANKYKHTRLPIIDRGELKGILNIKSLLMDKSRRKFDISRYTYPSSNFKTTDIVAEAFKILKVNRQHMGVITNAQNKIVGILTIEDIVEKLVGELINEEDIIKDGVFKLSTTTYQVLPSAKVKDVFTKYIKTKMPEGITTKTTFNTWWNKISKDVKTDEKKEHIHYNNLFIWEKSDKINKDKKIYEVDIFKE